MTWWDYVKSVAGDDTNAQIADAVGVSAPSVSRWNGKNKADVNIVAAFARAYGRPVLEAFVAAGFLTSDEAGEQPSAPPSLASLNDDDLLDEVRRRMQGGQSWGAGDTLGPEDDGAAGGSVVSFPPPVEGSGAYQDRAARRGQNEGKRRKGAQDQEEPS
ncbi:helix-turn-helix transcriptional regulator [Aestuariimicrobium sp. p3-SID1156]|uniref:helix-turn-helix domain-containing protein n=1 Tax=Aestuariimicrobium sp. p3-SID1156 TaxID=2916038 RepID=UPI00223BF2EC|nr:helix-turn-helix transcriptional regulator [Aestuariimicrobium sp. p3-SID1156]MCT1459911.1 helix-turn-helix transcriptional regulator [Aestuariimicrobium sp. p3-SID1156]